jgi:hypothetical protein
MQHIGEQASMFILYAKLLWPYWLAAMGTLAVVWGEHTERFAPKFKERINKLIKPDSRRRIEVAVMIIVLLFAGFEAWEDRYEAGQKSELQRISALQWLAIWKTRADDRWHAIHDASTGYADTIKDLRRQLAEKPKVITKTVNVPVRQVAVAGIPNLGTMNKIAALVREGQTIADTFAQKGDADLIAKQYAIWFAKVDGFLSKMPNPAYAAQFESAQGNGQMLTNRSIVGDGYWATLNGKTSSLATILSEMQH